LDAARLIRPGYQIGENTYTSDIDYRLYNRIYSANLEEGEMAESVYKIIELVGTSSESWEKAAASAVEQAAKTLRDLRIAEIQELDMQLADGKVIAYRAKVKVSFKVESKID